MKNTARAKCISNILANVVGSQQSTLDKDTSQPLLFLKDFVALPVVLQQVAWWLSPGPPSQTAGSRGNESLSNTNLQPKGWSDSPHTPKVRGGGHKAAWSKGGGHKGGAGRGSSARYRSPCPWLVGNLLEQRYRLAITSWSTCTFSDAFCFRVPTWSKRPREHGRPNSRWCFPAAMSCVEAVSSCTALLRSADHNKGLYQLIKKKTNIFF